MRQHLNICNERQAAGLLTGLALLSQAVVSSPSTPATDPSGGVSVQRAGGYGLFCWVYGFGMGAYHYALKMFVYQRVRARNFARAWSFVQASQALPLVCGIPLAGIPALLCSPTLPNSFIYPYLLHNRQSCFTRKV